MEGFKDFFYFLLSNALSRVLDNDLCYISDLLKRHLYNSSIRRILDRIAEKIRDNLLNSRLITFGHDGLMGDPRSNFVFGRC